jgi:GWxTD domain-containing protein
VQRSQTRILILVLVVGLISFPAVGQHSVRGLTPEYRKWLDEDVRWIITTPERKEFKGLSSDEQRAQFVAAFWERRNPTPGSKKNPFKEEHYRRMAYANEHFAAQVAGWRTDLGRIYVVYGPPDSIVKKPQEGQKFAEEVWTYVHMPGGGENVSLRFVDECVCGFYELESELPNAKWRNDVPGMF